MQRNWTIRENLIAALSLVLISGASVHAGTPPEPRAAEPEALRLLVVTGGHKYQTSFYTMFEGYDDWTWMHETTPIKEYRWDKLEAYRDDFRDKYDVLVLFDLAREDMPEQAQKNLRDFVESGKGVVVLHHAIANQGYGEWWYKDVVKGLYLLQPMMGRAGSIPNHGEILIARPTIQHPITKGVGELRLHDEAYKDMWISPEVTVLMETDNPNSDRQVVWISPYKKSRVVYIEMGHDNKAHLHPGYRKLIRQAIQWSAGR
jgi:type 1 glutamine amidotransferase